MLPSGHDKVEDKGASTEQDPIDEERRDTEAGSDTHDDDALPNAWRQPLVNPSLPETYNTVSVAPEDAPWYRKLLSFTGLGFIVSVGYMDPGNWATDVAGGSRFGYDLLFVVLCASLAAMFLQYLALKLGVATERDLAQACRDSFPVPVVWVLWVVMEVAMVATDMAELLGAAIGLYLLTGLALPIGVVVVGLDVLVILVLQEARLRFLEALVMLCTGLILACLVYIVVRAQPDGSAMMQGFLPSGPVFTNPDELFLAIGILGATVMPHNLFLHSALVQSRQYARTPSGRAYAVRFAAWDSALSLTLAFVVNALILVMGAAAFSGTLPDTEDIFQAYDGLEVVLGSSTPGTVFAVALLASGQQASLTGTLAGQIVMEGMLNVRVTPWKRRFVTRLVALVPTVVISAVMGQDSIRLLVVSQVVISLTLSFASVPLVYLTSLERKMGKAHVNSWCTVVVGVIVVTVIGGFNMYLLGTTDWASL